MAEADLVTLSEADLPERAALCAATLPYDDCSPSLLRYTLFQSTPAEPVLPLGLRAAGRLVAVAIGALNRTPDGPVGHVKLVVTAPDVQRRGYGKRLLGELERRFRRAGATTRRLCFARRYFVPGVDLRHSRALCFFDRLGYTRGAFTYNLDVDLTRRSFDPGGHSERLASAGVTLRRLEQEDEERFTRYLAERWGAGSRDEGLQALRTGQTPLPGHIALAGETIVGFAVYDVVRPGWLGPIGTNAEQRGQRIGTALLHACLFDWQRQGRRHGEIAGIGPLYFYVESCDAVIARAFQRYDKALLPPPASP